MEEWIGQKWHHYITSKTASKFPHATVHLDDLKGQIGLFFRALGGDHGVTLGNTSAKCHNGYRHWLQKVSGTGKKSELGHFCHDYLYLPQSINCFPEYKLNEDLYFWLAAMASFNLSPHPEYLLEHNHYLTQQVLIKWPGLRITYTKLATAHLEQRQLINSLPINIKKTEHLIRSILENPNQRALQKHSYQSRDMPQPVVLWLQPTATNTVNNVVNNETSEDSHSQSKITHNKNKKRYQTEQVDAQEENDGFISFRLESLFSWSEYIPVDRTEDDDEDEDAGRVADDLDRLSISQGETGHSIRLDLDLPSSEYDDIIIKDGIVLPEWDYKKNRYQEGYCALQIMQLKNTQTAQWPTELKRQARRIKQQFELLMPARKWQPRQADGDEVDVNEFIQFKASQTLNKSPSSPKLYRQLQNTERSLATLILVDLSLSTDAHVNNQKKVIDVIKEALYIFSESLASAGEHFAIAGFTSKKRSHVRYYPIKNFEDEYDRCCQDQIFALQPAYYTRMGAAIRYASEQLEYQPSKQKLLIILTDGKPNDLDKYESRYGLEDSKKAISESKSKNITPFCVSIDFAASDYLPYIFGSQGFVHLNEVDELTEKLPKLFYQLAI